MPLFKATSVALKKNEKITKTYSVTFAGTGFAMVTEIYCEFPEVRLVTDIQTFKVIITVFF